MSGTSKIYMVMATAAVFTACLSAPVFVAEAGKLPSSEQLLNVESGVGGIIQQGFIDKPYKNLKDVKALQAFYERRIYRPYWVTGARVKSNGRELIRVLEESWEHGLNPKAYHLDKIYALMQEKGEAPLAQIDLLLSDAYTRLGQDLTGIRVDPRFMKSHRRYWQASLSIETLLKQLDRERNVKTLMGALEPRGQTYKRLQEELVRLVEGEPEPYEAVLPIRISGALHPYARDEGVPNLRARLDLAEPKEADVYLYDDTLAAAVIDFQRQNGLKDDGIVGKQTLDILNQSRNQKIKQVIANLERLRWVEEDKPETFVVVNVPSARLWAVENGQVAFEMPVIVGRAKRPTNIFRTEIHGVRLNPTWTVPPTIKRDDILPKLREDPEYLTHKGMQLISGRGDEAITLDPLAFDWANIAEEELKGLRMVQTPGAHNPLGRVRVLMPNGYNIYLHDTNERHYFQRANRAASSGCVRLEDPERMANFILKQRRNWDGDALSERLVNPETQDLFIPDPIPVYLLYYTVWLNDQGQIVYGNDLYEFDKDLIKMLEDIDGIFIPVDNT